MKKIRAGIVFGGRSGEHEVSVVSASSVVDELSREKFEIFLFGITKSGEWRHLPFSQIKKSKDTQAFLKTILKKGEKCTPVLDSEKGYFLLLKGKKAVRVDAVFPVLHGTFGEDGTIQGLFEMMNIPYVGSGVLGSSAGMDKDLMKHLFRSNGLPVVNWMAFCQEEPIPAIRAKVKKNFTFPVFVKPANLGSSVGISKVSKESELAPALKEAFLYDYKIVVEQGYAVREIECSVMGNFEIKASVPGEIVPKGDTFYSYKAKYQNTGSELYIPAKLSPSVTKKIREYAVRAFRAVEGRGMSRIDFFVTRKGGKVFVNEINTIPGFTSISMFPKLFAKTGLPYRKLLEKLFELALEIHAVKNSKKYSWN